MSRFIVFIIFSYKTLLKYHSLSYIQINTMSTDTSTLDRRNKLNGYDRIYRDQKAFDRLGIFPQKIHQHVNVYRSKSDETSTRRIETPGGLRRTPYDQDISGYSTVHDFPGLTLYRGKSLNNENLNNEKNKRSFYRPDSSYDTDVISDYTEHIYSKPIKRQNTNLVSNQDQSNSEVRTPAATPTMSTTSSNSPIHTTPKRPQRTSTSSNSSVQENDFMTELKRRTSFIRSNSEEN